MSEYSLEGASTKLASLVLEDETQFHSRAIGAIGPAVREAVFNTSMTGYQEIPTDLSYPYQIVTPTYPHIGNVGINDADEEFSQVHAQGLVICDLSLIASNLRNTEDLSSYLKRHNTVAIADIDTRKLMCLPREKGAQNDCVIAGDNPDAALALEKARAFLGLNDMNLAKGVTTAESYNWIRGSWTLTGGLPEAKKEDELPHHVVAYDFGAKRNILCTLVDRGCCLTIVPAQISAEDMLKMNPSGISLPNDPGDPVPCDYAITTIQRFLETNTPVFGICLGYQLLALASGAKIAKMEFGHHGGNHPVKDVEKNVVMITTQNYGFTVDEVTLSASLRVTRKSLFDGTLRGTHRTDKPALSFQGRPEASPGPHGVAPLFDHFITLIGQYRRIAK